jgi:hypothetical protein
MFCLHSTTDGNNQVGRISENGLNIAIVQNLSYGLWKQLRFKDDLEVAEYLSVCLGMTLKLWLVWMSAHTCSMIIKVSCISNDSLVCG